MKTAAMLLALIILAIPLSAQVPVKKDLMEMLDKIPFPPTSVKNAYAKIAQKDKDGTEKCSAEQMFKSIEEEVQSIEAEFAAQPKPSADAAVPGLSPETAKKMSDPEMKKKMKKMSKEEKMQMAMEMMKSMPTGAPATETDTPSVRAALDEWQIIYNDTQNEFQRSADELQKEIKLTEEYQKAQSEADSWEAAEIDKLPQISSGEMSAPDPIKVKEVKLKSSDKHIAIANKRLEHIRTQLQATVDHAKKRYTAFYKKLVAADYAADSKNFSSKKILADAQLSLLVTIGHCIKLSRNAWEESASWQARRMDIEKQ